MAKTQWDFNADPCSYNAEGILQCAGFVAPAPNLFMGPGTTSIDSSDVYYNESNPVAPPPGSYTSRVTLTVTLQDDAYVFRSSNMGTQTGRKEVTLGLPWPPEPAAGRAASAFQDVDLNFAARTPPQEPELGYNINVNVFEDTNGNGVRDADEAYVFATTQFDFNADPCAYNAEGILQCAGLVAPAPAAFLGPGVTSIDSSDVYYDEVYPVAPAPGSYTSRVTLTLTLDGDYIIDSNSVGTQIEPNKIALGLPWPPEPIAARATSAFQEIDLTVATKPEPVQNPAQDAALRYNINLHVFDDTNNNGVHDGDEQFITTMAAWDFNGDPCVADESGNVACAGLLAPDPTMLLCNGAVSIDSNDVYYNEANPVHPGPGSYTSRVTLNVTLQGDYDIQTSSLGTKTSANQLALELPWSPEDDPTLDLKIAAQSGAQQTPAQQATIGYNVNLNVFDDTNGNGVRDSDEDYLCAVTDLAAGGGAAVHRSSMPQATDDANQGMAALLGNGVLIIDSNDVGYDEANPAASDMSEVKVTVALDSDYTIGARSSGTQVAPNQLELTLPWPPANNLARQTPGFEDVDVDVPAQSNADDYDPASCSMSLTPARVSGDYTYGGNTYVTASTLVSWDGAPSGETITISLRDNNNNVIESRTLTQEYAPLPGNPATTETVPLQEIAFEVAADGASTYSIDATFSGGACTSNVVNFSAPLGYTSPACTAADLGGQIFKDFDMDGGQGDAETIGVGDVTITVYGDDGSVNTTQSDRYGNYLVSVPNDAYPVRVEFSNIAQSPYFATSGPNGNDSATTVQFVSAPSCAVNLGLADPNLFCQANPDVMLSCFVGGDPLNMDALADNTPARDLDTLVSFSYALTGGKDMTNMAPIAVGQETGSVWGLAWDRYQNRLYSAAALVRSIGLGPLGLGGIYVTEYTADGDGLPSAWDATGTTSSFVDITALTDSDGTPIDVGAIASNGARGLVPDPTVPTRDTDAFGLIGKIGLGDIDIAGDGSALFVTNLFERTLVEIPLPADGSTPTAATSYAIPIDLLNCQNGVQRPWAVKVHEGNVFVGVTCTGENSRSKVDLAAAVLRFQPISQTWDMLFDFPLTYPRGYAHGAPGSSLGTPWHPWTDDISLSQWFVDTRVGGFDVVEYSQPMFSDIEFDIDGSMILTLADRAGFQIQGYLAPDPATDDSWDGGGIITVSGGDVLRAYYGGGDTYLLENNGKAGPNVGALPNTGGGPGLGEFYDDAFGGHTENALGAVALRPGSGEAVIPVVDPINVWSNGVRYVDNTTGGQLRNYEVVRGSENGIFYDSKASNLGDIELACVLPQILEIGNRIWLDTDRDGIQDPSEAAVPNVTVILYNTDGVEVARTDTDAAGTYIFTTADGVQTNTSYYVVVDSAEFNGGDLDGLFPALPFAGESLHDSNGIVLDPANDSSLPGSLVDLIGASVTTGGLIENDHTIDMGFVDQPVFPIVGDFVWLDTNGNGQQDANEPGLANVVINLYNNEGTLVNTTTTNGDGNYVFNTDNNGNQLPADNYYIIVTPPAGYAFTTQNNTGDDTNDSDINPATGQSDTLLVELNDINLTFDAGLVPIMSIGSTVFYDRDDSGTQDSNESGIADVTVELYDGADNLLATTQTDDSGHYLFDELEPGAYYVRIPTPPTDAPISSTGFDATDAVDGNDNGQQPGGSGSPTVSPIITLVGNDEPTNDGMETAVGNTQDDAYDRNGNMTVDFGFRGLLGIIGGEVFDDRDSDGIQDGVDLGVEGITVNLLDENNEIVDTTQTNAVGAYTFDNVEPGTYSVQFIKPDDKKFSPQDQGDDFKVDSDVDATGVTEPFSIDPGGENRYVDAGLVDDINPSFTFEKTIENQDADTLDQAVQATVNDDLTFDYMVENTGDVAIEWTTLNDDVFGNLTSECRLPTIIPVTGSASCMVTRAAGDYPEGKRNIGSVTIRNVGTAEDPAWYVTDPQNATIKGTVFNDVLQDGIQDAVNEFGGDPGISGIQVNLYDAIGNQVGSTVTSADDPNTPQDETGNYQFVGVTPDALYRVEFVVPDPESYITLKDQGGDDTVDSDANPTSGRTDIITVGEGEVSDHNDAGLYDFLQSKPATLGNKVFEDLDGDGMQDGPEGTPEPGVPNVTVQLLTPSGTVLETQTTDSDGMYLFTGLIPDDYVVRFVLPNGYDAFTDKDAGIDETADSDADPSGGSTQGETDMITLGLSEVNLDVDAGVVKFVSVGDYVWEDLNANGIQDTGEPGVEGVTVELFEVGNTTPLASTTTDGNGLYSFTDLHPGEYYVVFEQPAGYEFTDRDAGDDAGNDDAVDSDANPNSGADIGATDSVVVPSGTSNQTLDTGVVQPGSIGDTVFADENNDGIQDPSEAGVPNVVVNLLDENGNEIATTTTDENGNYEFPVLPGTYIVAFEAPNGFVLSPQDQGGDDNADSDPDPTTGQTAPVTVASGEDVNHVGVKTRWGGS
ncbi:MAG: SdrD B-like domain-containing protein [Chloroflexota bacterium]